MASGTWEDLLAGGGNDSVPEGFYEVEVTGARTNANARQVWLDLKVLSGPQAGHVPSVSIYLPNPEAEKFRGQLFNFQKRIAGFDVSVLKSMDPDSPLESQLAILADALTGQRTTAEIQLRADGEYAGTNQLASTKSSGAAPAAAPAIAVAEVPRPTPKAEETVVPETTSVEDASAALDGEVPF